MKTKNAKVTIGGVMLGFLLFAGNSTVNATEENHKPHVRLEGDVNGDGVKDEVTILHPDFITVIVNVALGNRDGDRDGHSETLTEWMRSWRGHADAYILLDVDRNGRDDLVMVTVSTQPMEWQACRSDGRAFYNCSVVHDRNLARRIFAILAQQTMK